MEVDHDLVVVDEFDALAIELKVPLQHLKPSSTSSSAQTAPATTPPPSSTLSLPLAKVKEVIEGSQEVTKAGKYPAKEHAQKVAKELGVENGLIYLPGKESKAYEDSDMAPEFRQRRYFYYLGGADFANCAVTYDIARDSLILWIPYTDPLQVLWFGTTPGISECKARVQVDDVRFISGLSRYLQVYLSARSQSTLFVIHPDQAPVLDPRHRGIGVVHIDSARLQPAMDAARVVKTAYEVAMIRRANAISSAAHRAILVRLKRLSNEREIEAVFRGFCLAHGAKRQAYPVIAGSGPNAGTLHYDANNEPLAGRQLVVLDAGCEWNCYASDITRTLPIGGIITPESAAIYSIVEKMQDECIARVKPGLVYYTLHMHACMIAVTELLKLGVLRGGSASDIFAKGTVAAFFPHGLGHHVGLEVHDVSGRERLMLGAAVGYGGRKGHGSIGKREWVAPEMLAMLYRDAVTAPPPYKGRQKLKKNMIVTIEPGIYFCRAYIEACFLSDPTHAQYIDKTVLEKYYPVGGVRIEDDILVTDDGYENLTTAPRGEEALRIINEN